MKPAVSGILETSLYVDDIDRSVEFYQRIFGFEPMFHDRRLCALAVGSQVLLLFRKGASREDGHSAGGVIPGHDGDGHLHMAFAIASADVDDWRHHLESSGVDIESTVQWELGGTSLYFRDPDSHVIELATRGTWKVY